MMPEDAGQNPAAHQQTTFIASPPGGPCLGGRVDHTDMELYAGQVRQLALLPLVRWLALLPLRGPGGHHLLPLCVILPVLWSARSDL